MPNNSASDKPFPETLKELLEERDWSARELHRQLRRRAPDDLSHSTVGFLMQGELDPSPSAIEKIAKVLHIRPDYFAEYRLAKRREALDPKAVGLRRALKNSGE